MKRFYNGIRSRGFTLVELLVVIAIIGVLIALLLPAVQAAREAARRSQCVNHLKQFSLACHNYHSTHSVLPPYAVTVTSDPLYGSNWLVLILPFIEQQAITDMIAAGGTAASVDGTQDFAAGPGRVKTDATNYKPWLAKFSSRICPSDPNGNQEPALYTLSDTIMFTGVGSYRANVGDCTANLTDVANNEDRRVRMRGPFMFQRGQKLTDITDGTSNTFLLSEALAPSVDDLNNARSAIVTPPSSGAGSPDWCLTSLDPNDLTRFKTTGGWQGREWKGRRWNDLEYPYAAFITIMAPNSPACITHGTNSRNAPIVPAQSGHPGGANHSRADGTVLFVPNTVDTGDSSQTAWHSLDPARPLPSNKKESPYGVYGAMGTATGKETKSL